jgi:hypothetical protein
MKITNNYIFSFQSITREKDEKLETESGPKLYVLWMCWVIYVQV